MKAFLSHLAVDGNVAASTQNQAFNALVFLYRKVLHQPFENVQGLGFRRGFFRAIICRRSIIAQLVVMADEALKASIARQISLMPRHSIERAVQEVPEAAEATGLFVRQSFINNFTVGQPL